MKFRVVTLRIVAIAIASWLGETDARAQMEGCWVYDGTTSCTAVYGPAITRTCFADGICLADGSCDVVPYFETEPDVVNYPGTWNWIREALVGEAGGHSFANQVTCFLQRHCASDCVVAPGGGGLRCIVDRAYWQIPGFVVDFDLLGDCVGLPPVP